MMAVFWMSVSAIYQNLSLAMHEVNFRENVHAIEVYGKIVTVCYWVPIRYCNIVEAPIVTTWTLSS